jgi:hypothetical protein
MPLIFWETGLLATENGLAGSLACCCLDGCCDLGETLTGTITEKTGDATNLPDSTTFNKQSPLTWRSGTLQNPCDPGSTFGMTLACVNDVWTLIGAAITGFTATLTSADCTTKVVEFDVTFDDGAGCAGSFHIRIGP